MSNLMNRLESLTTNQLIDVFEQLPGSPEARTVRSAVRVELFNRDSEAYCAWRATDDASPRAYFATVAA